MHHNAVAPRDHLRDQQAIEPDGGQQIEVQLGIGCFAIVIDPRIGFGKSIVHNLELIRNLGTLKELGSPVLLGASRKAFIGWLTGVETAGDRLGGSVGAALAAVEGGADIVRVHDVAATAQALAVRHAAVHGLPAAPRG